MSCSFRCGFNGTGTARSEKHGGKGSHRPGEPERSGGSDRLAAVLVRATVGCVNPWEGEEPDGSAARSRAVNYVAHHGR